MSIFQLKNTSNLSVKDTSALTKEVCSAVVLSFLQRQGTLFFKDKNGRHLST